MIYLTFDLCFIIHYYTLLTTRFAHNTFCSQYILLAMEKNTPTSTTSSPIHDPTQQTTETITSPFINTLDADSHPPHLNYISEKVRQLCTKNASPISEEYLIKTLKPVLRHHRRKELVDVLVATTFLIVSSWKMGKRQSITISERKNVVAAFDPKISAKDVKKWISIVGNDLSELNWFQGHPVEMAETKRHDTEAPSLIQIQSDPLPLPTSQQFTYVIHSRWSAEKRLLQQIKTQFQDNIVEQLECSEFIVDLLDAITLSSSCCHSPAGLISTVQEAVVPFNGIVRHDDKTRNIFVVIQCIILNKRRFSHILRMSLLYEPLIETGHLYILGMNLMLARSDLRWICATYASRCNNGIRQRYPYFFRIFDLYTRTCRNSSTPSSSYYSRPRYIRFPIKCSLHSSCSTSSRLHCMGGR